jgi:peptidylprolyl isomerase
MQAKKGDTVKVNYTGKFEDGTVFDSSEGREPLEFTVGEGEVIEGFDEGVVGMSPGDSKTVTITMDKAYGPHRADRVLAVNRNEFPPNIEPEVGQQYEIEQPNGMAVAVTVTDVSEDAVTLDANHPLAGEDLTFDIQLVEIE